MWAWDTLLSIASVNGLASCPPVNYARSRCFRGSAAPTVNIFAIKPVRPMCRHHVAFRRNMCTNFARLRWAADGICRTTVVAKHHRCRKRTHWASHSCNSSSFNMATVAHQALAAPVQHPVVQHCFISSSSSNSTKCSRCNWLHPLPASQSRLSEEEE